MSTQLNTTIQKSTRIAQLFIGWNIGFFIAALLLQDSIASDTVGAVLFRGGFYAVGGLILLFCLRQMSQGKRSGLIRLRIITILAPLGVVAFILFTPHLPVWFDVGQVGSALMLASIATFILRPDVKLQFPKTPKA